MGGQAIGNDVKGALVDISSGDSDQYSEDTQGTGTALSDNRIASKEIEMMDSQGLHLLILSIYLLIILYSKRI